MTSTSTMENYLFIMLLKLLFEVVRAKEPQYPSKWERFIISKNIIKILKGNKKKMECYFISIYFACN